MQFTNTIMIDRPPAEVFAFLANFENVPRWNYAISQTRKITRDPVGVGSRYEQTRTLPTPSAEMFEVTTYEPNQKLSIRGTFGPFVGSATYVLDPMDNATHLINTMDLEPSGLVKLVAPLAASRVKAAVAANLDTLRQLLEHQ